MWTRSVWNVPCRHQIIRCATRHALLKAGTVARCRDEFAKSYISPHNVACCACVLRQLHRIFSVIGTPSPDAISRLSNPTMRSCLLKLANVAPKEPQDLAPK